MGVVNIIVVTWTTISCLLDALPGTDGPDLQAALKVMTGQGTVPNIFVNGKHLGGCDSTLAAIASGELQKMLKNQFT
jgi:glutaredoxin-related protein